MIYQYAYNIKKVNSVDDISALTKFVSDERKEKIRKYRFDKDKIRSIFAEIVLRYALYHRYGLKDKDVVFDKTEFEKPFLKNNDNIFFNLSHSGDWVICAVGDKSVGIDVELIEDIDFSIMEDIFTKEECENLLAQNENDRLRMFYNIWTLKESYTKNTGDGLNLPLKSIMFHIDKDNIIFYTDGKINVEYSFYLRKLDDKHSMSMCVKGGSVKNISNESLTIVLLEDIMRWKDILYE